MSWDETRVEMLTRLWKLGLSGNQIAARIGNVSRNAVIGKIHRLGLSGRVERTNDATQQRKVQARRKTHSRKAGATGAFRLPKPPVLPLPPPAEFDVARYQLGELGPDACRWPVGDPGEEKFGFCGLTRIVGSSDCDVHQRRAYRGGEDD